MDKYLFQIHADSLEEFGLYELVAENSNGKDVASVLLQYDPNSGITDPSYEWNIGNHIISCEP